MGDESYGDYRVFNHLPEGKARRSDPQTSHQAARSVQTSDLEGWVLAALRSQGPQTTEQLSERLNISLQSITPRMRPLVTKGLVRDSGARLKGENGRSRIVWAAQ
jgi:predicted ArsR family transcriptional regulator